ncbi:hypothetical protein Pyn_26549 [Prunus yedoensis var. nudiflora]|uniref:Uncharacterized protein n=1 Tax=Prunus yedoensis var. nudiflora TaxID=2094558 RepID=A0A314XXT5_PRUYE|nr:hypothetical protein Pyn_26549 [Prunus yedoensis var. nudiflora]
MARSISIWTGSGLPAVVGILLFPGARPSREFALPNTLKDTGHVDSTESV